MDQKLFWGLIYLFKCYGIGEDDQGWGLRCRARWTGRPYFRIMVVEQHLIEFPRNVIGTI